MSLVVLIYSRGLYRGCFQIFLNQIYRIDKYSQYSLMFFVIF